MSDKITDKIFQYIDAIAQKLGVATEYVLTALIKQQVIEGIVQVAICLILTTVAVIGWKKCFKNVLIERDENKGKSYYAEKSEFWMTLHIISAFVAFVVIVTSAFLVPIGIMKICNPEYYAVKEILSVFSGK